MSNKHCLVVDDSDVVRRVTKHMLGALRFDASDAVSGYDALECCRKSMPDAILLDSSMPALSGPTQTSLECLQSLRRMPGGKAPIVLYCTAENDPAEFARAIQAGATDVLVKPFDREALRQKLIAVGLL